MKTIARILVLLVVSIALGFAAHAIVQASASSAMGLDGAQGSGSPGGHGAESRAGTGGPQGGSGNGLVSIALVLAKFFGILLVVAGLRALILRTPRVGKRRIS